MLFHIKKLIISNLKTKLYLRLDAFYGFPENPIKPRQERYRRFRDIEGLEGTENSDSSGGSRGLGDIRDISRHVLKVCVPWYPHRDICPMGGLCPSTIFCISHTRVQLNFRESRKTHHMISSSLFLSLRLFNLSIHIHHLIHCLNI